MLFEVLPGAGRLVSKAAQSSYSVGNGEREAAADVGWVCAARQQQLANFSWLLIQISLDESVAINPNVDVQKVDKLCTFCPLRGHWEKRKQLIRMSLMGY